MRRFVKLYAGDYGQPTWVDPRTVTQISQNMPMRTWIHTNGETFWVAGNPAQVAELLGIGLGEEEMPAWVK